jgi:lysophospholipase L1-like esterase
MPSIRAFAFVAILTTTAAAQQTTPPPTSAAAPKPPAKVRPQLNEITQFSRFAADNEALGPPAAGTRRVVFYGDSLTDNWGRKYGQFFPGKPYVNRGISGQTTPQMLLRFQQDVVHLQPAAVLILAGVNDFAENTGPITDAQLQDNFRSMVAIAKQNHIRVILASCLPASSFPWHKGINPAERIKVLNAWLQKFSAEQHLTYLDYYTHMVAPDGGIQPDLAIDQAVHPNDAGYAIMQPLAEAAIAKSLAQPAP